MRGFLEGLETKFEEQVQQMRDQGNALMVLVPKEVEDKYKQEVTGKAVTLSVPSASEWIAYQTGYRNGNEIDYTKSTIDDIS